MKTKIIPFNLETAKKIQAGEIEGKIKTRDSKDVDEIVVFRSPLAYNVYAVINGRPRSFTDRGLERIWDESGTWSGDLVLEVPDNEPQFKPFDKVLVRSHIKDFWKPAIFQYFCESGSFPYKASGEFWLYMIPYEGNEHLIGITDKPKEE